ncbi:unnamed protein product [Blumeria hordei]|uniref:Uncharacterized protein n=1 Tax=Blumeria hordei TaxID=2867405 RepID=A0A383UZU9_BLUHO|nr:unnamed protein product [Blumeria hordei]
MEFMSLWLIQPISPANSPDLSQIEAVLDRMRDYILCHHPNLGGGQQRTPDSLRKIAKETWDYISLEDLVRLIESLPAICQAVIDADGGPTRFYCLKIFQPHVQIQGYDKTICFVLFIYMLGTLVPVALLLELKHEWGRAGSG